MSASSTQQFLVAAAREDTRSTGRWLTSNDVLDWANTAINALATVADRISVPYLKLAAELTKQVIEVIQTVRENKSSALDMGQQTFEYTRIIIEMYKGSESQDLRPFDANVEQFNETLEEVLGTLKKIALRKLVKRVVRHQKDKRRIADAKTKLEHSFRRFNLANELIMVQHVQELQETTQEARAHTIDIAQVIPVIQENVQVLVQDSARVETNLGAGILQTNIGINTIRIELGAATRRVQRDIENMRREIYDGDRHLEAYVSQAVFGVQSMALVIEQAQGSIQQVVHSKLDDTQRVARQDSDELRKQLVRDMNRVQRARRSTSLQPTSSSLSPSMSPPPTVVSSPGKVLLAGGYLVLDPVYSGVVVSTSSRFYTVVSDLPSPSSAEHEHEIRVRSPQFVGASYRYTVRIEESDACVHVEQVANADDTPLSKNKFVQLALERTLRLARERISHSALAAALSRGLDIRIVGDNDFYSQRAQLAARNLPPTLASLSQLPPFLHTGVPLSDVHKTGLGSSAALITSLVSALLLHLRVIPRDAFSPQPAEPASGADAFANDGRRLAHNTAQYVHCLAQGKVGSGFDVASAVFGSQIYTRFGPRVLEPLMHDSLAAGQSLSRVLDPANPAWDYRVAPFGLPPKTRLMLADVDAGTDTPSFVGKVLKWRKEQSVEANALWDALNASNQLFSRTILALNEMHAANPADYAIVVKYLSTLQHVQVHSPPSSLLDLCSHLWRSLARAQWLAHPSIPPQQLPMIEAFSQVRQAAEDIRAKMREMSTRAGVPIEPPEQTALLDACVSVAGVIGGGVPGAGGYDALWLLVFDPVDCPPTELPAHRVEALWGAWTGLRVSPLSAVESTGRGVRVEDIDGVPGLKEAIAA
ncbi:hypothetical protein EIP86_003427 [Pleurotus ostreatoroseus]|nr:hypothetical protein EIP86_003427 [Pleurotus ostreatoroseus]